MTDQEKAREIAEYYTDINDIGVALNSAKEMGEWKDQQFRELLEERFSDIIFECICEYNKLKGSLNDDGTLCSDYRLAQDINIICQAKFIHELLKEEQK